MAEENAILVSVCMLTYNHEKFIAQAIEGVIAQQVNFRYELIIGEDCSTDATGKICKEYKEKYPDKIKLIMHETNLGAKKNCLFTFSQSVGKYIAICEGDDFWTDNQKLQKQVDFLENNPDYGLVHTNYDVVDENGKKLQWFTAYKGKKCDSKNGDAFELLLRNKNTIGTLTVLFRAQLLFRDAFLDELRTMELKMLDYPMWLEFAKQAKVGYIDSITSSYRVLENSASHSESAEKTLDFNLNSLYIRLYFAQKYGIRLNENKEKAQIYSNILRDCFLYEKRLSTRYYMEMIKTYLPFALNPRPLLFLLGSRFAFFHWLIYRINDSGPVCLKRHFSV